MRIKICGIQNEAELKLAVAMGADAVGFQVGQLYPGKNFILPSTAARLAGELPPFITPVVVTHLNRADEIDELMDRCGIGQVQLLRPPVEEVCKLRDRLPRQAKITVTEFVRYPVIDFDLTEYYAVIDAVNLDCYNQEPAALAFDQLPKHYQWDTAAEFVQGCPVPVILCGRLAPDNVAEAAALVRPYGVDVCTGVKAPESGECDPERLREFIRQARHDFLRD